MDTISSSTSLSPKYYKCSYGKIELLRADNYPIWSTTITFFLKADRTWNIVVGNTTAPVLPEHPTPRERAHYNAELEDYESKAARACSMIISAIEDSYKQFVYGKTDPKDMWDTLKDQLDSMNSSVGPFLLRSEFLKSKYTGSGPVLSFLFQLRQYYTRLLSTKCAITEADIISHALSNNVLPSRFEQTVKSLRPQAPDLTWDSLTKTLIREDIQSRLQPDSISTVVPISSTTAIGNSNPKGRKPNSRRSWIKKRRHFPSKDTSDSDQDQDDEKDRFKDLQCFYCCRKGHRSSECRLKRQAEKLRKKRKSIARGQAT